jgi:Flp pilus assembly protein TadD
MNTRRSLWKIVLLSQAVAGGAWAAEMELKLKELQPSLSRLASGSRTTVDQAVQLIRKGQHTAALAHLTELSRANPDNSAVKVVLAYGLLQAGNLVGAFDRAKEAEAAPDHTSYVCLFLARVAYLVGDPLTCRREVEHVRQAGDYKTEVRALERDLNAKSANR